MKSRTLVPWLGISLVLHAAILLPFWCVGLNLFVMKTPLAFGSVGVTTVELVDSCQPAMAGSATRDSAPRTQSRRASSPAKPKAPRTKTARAPSPKPEPIKSPKRSEPTSPKNATPEPARPAEPAPAKDSSIQITTAAPTQVSGSRDNAPTVSREEPSSPGNGSVSANPSPILSSSGAAATSVASPIEKIVSPPRYDSNPLPIYPDLARKRHWEGDVFLRALIGETGDVLNVRVETSSGHELLDSTALETVRQWRFHPAHDGEKNVREEVCLSIRFKLENSRL